MNGLGIAGGRCLPTGVAQRSNRDSFWSNEGRIRWVIGCAVVLLHVWILAIIANVSHRWHLPRETAYPLVLLNLSTVPTVPKVRTRLGAQQRVKSSLASGRGERLSQSDGAERRESGESIQTPQPDSTGPLIDWSSELDTVAKAEASELLAERRQKCHDAEMHGELLAGCGKVKTPDIWRPPSNVAGLLAVGKRIANGHIFDAMRDPDRDRSSVPDVAELQKRRHRPAPLAVDPRREDFIR
jgi:hypothetical protein